MVLWMKNINGFCCAYIVVLCVVSCGDLRESEDLFIYLINLCWLMVEGLVRVIGLGFRFFFMWIFLRVFFSFFVGWWWYLRVNVLSDRKWEFLVF